jgi:hypothetical protein
MFKRLFNWLRRYRVSLGRVHDLIEVREGTERLMLRVDADPMDLVRMINSLEPRLSAIQDDAQAEQEAGGIAREFCDAIFGETQTNRLFDFYNSSGECVLGIIGKYFSERLGKLITKAQKKARL